MLPILGAQLEYALGGRDKYAVKDRIYHFPIKWDECEMAPHVYQFPNWMYDTVTRLNMKLGQANYKLVIGVKTCPSFYSTGNQRNSPPKPEHYDEFAKLIEAVCLAFHPFAVEIWNEPEFTQKESASDAEYFGGFGLDGKSYGEMCRVIYDYLRSINEPTKVITGASFGILNPERALKFLEDAVNAGMSADYWSWHSYFKYSDVIYGFRPFYQALWFSDKAYEIFPVQQIITETSILRDTDRPELDEHRQRQVEWLKFVIRKMGTDDMKHIESVLWYTLAETEWMHSSMVFRGIVYPVYDVWKNY